MAGMKLDDTDRRILANLQANGRMTNVELARRVGISAPPCLRRVRALEQAGYIKGYHAEVNGEMLGFSVAVYALVGLKGQSETELRAFEARCADWPLVRGCTMLQGENDFVLKVVAPNLEAYNHFLTHELTAAPNVAHVKSSLVIRTSKAEPGVPIDVELVKPARARSA
jgi:DNA-binding Lrp family transcriptional regulator